VCSFICWRDASSRFGLTRWINAERSRQMFPKEVAMLTEGKRVIRHAAEAKLLIEAVEGDGEAANRVIQYLSSANPYLRQIMQRTLNDVADGRVWQQLLHCLAVQRWRGKVDCKRRTDVLASRRIDQSVIEAFLYDEADEDQELKEQVLHAGLKEDDLAVRYGAAYLLGLRGDRGVIPILAEAIEQGESRWQLCAIQALTALKDERCAAPLLRALEMDRDSLHRQARQALSELGPLAESAYVAALHHPDSHIRWHAARGLGEIGDPRAVKLLLEGLCDENRSVRWASAEALARLDASAVPEILRMLARSAGDGTCREAAYHALHAMRGRHTQERLKPLLEALRGPSAVIEAPGIAQRLLKEWDQSVSKGGA
jgi:hypothetical protein